MLRKIILLLCLMIVWEHLYCQDYPLTQVLNGDTTITFSINQGRRIDNELVQQQNAINQCVKIYLQCDEKEKGYQGTINDYKIKLDVVNNDLFYSKSTIGDLEFEAGKLRQKLKRKKTGVAIWRGLVIVPAAAFVVIKGVEYTKNK